MTTTSTVSHLVARFQLRRRAPSDSFASGVRLARLGAVTIDLIAPGELRATVKDAVSLPVRIVVDGEKLAGTCPCETAKTRICCHQVAATHALWVHDRRLGRTY